MAEEALYNNKKNKIRVTRSLLEAQGGRYPIRNISKIKLDKKGEKGGISYNSVFATFLAILIAFGISQPIVALIAVLAFFFAAVDPSTQPQPIFDLKIILSPNNEEITISPEDGDDLKALQKALEDAIDSTYHARDVKIISGSLK
ncbi:DUF6232 family protein [Microseira sp. BLCC-F43]|jgi:hypothetical protein|uniref:DUF6232 family protein n=1 Tax=Microseira sp. BLCC-F43 TaxID=3153602 RepID=UPI0035B9C823